MLKLGQKLKNKVGDEFHVGGICGEVVFLIDEKNDHTQGMYTEKELQHYGFTWEEEKWMPKMCETYYAADECGKVNDYEWGNDDVDKDYADHSLLGIHPTEALAKQSYEDAKKKLGK